MSNAITEINQDTFWALIAQAKEHPGGPNEWLMEQLMDLGPEQAKRFDTMARVYMDLAYQYGLWSAASVMEGGFCSDDGFFDFRSWLVGQGRDVYLAALADPDSLVGAPDYGDGEFNSLPHMGNYAYEELTGREAFEDFDPAGYSALKAELEKGIVYGEGINYPYDQANIPAYVPRLCVRYLTSEQIEALAQTQGCTWNLADPDILAARRGPKSSRVTGEVQEENTAIGDDPYTLKLYTGLRVDVSEADGGAMTLPDPDMPTGMASPRFRTYHSAVLAAIQADPPKNDITYLLKTDFLIQEALRATAEKIDSMVQTVEDVDGKFFGVTVCQLRGELDALDMTLLKGYCQILHDERKEVKQYRCPANEAHGELSVRIWRDRSRFMLTEQEIERAPWRKPKQKTKGGEAR